MRLLSFCSFPPLVFLFLPVQGIELIPPSLEYKFLIHRNSTLQNILDFERSWMSPHVISGFLQLLWMLYFSCMILCLCCKINKVIKSFFFCTILYLLLFIQYSYSNYEYSNPNNLRSKKNRSIKELTPYIVREQLHHMHPLYSQRAAPSHAQSLLLHMIQVCKADLECTCT